MQSQSPTVSPNLVMFSTDNCCFMDGDDRKQATLSSHEMKVIKFHICLLKFDKNIKLAPICVVHV